MPFLGDILVGTRNPNTHDVDEAGLADPGIRVGLLAPNSGCSLCLPRRISLSVCLSVSPLSPEVCLYSSSAHLSSYLLIYLSSYLSIYLSIYLSSNYRSISIYFFGSILFL